MTDAAYQYQSMSPIRTSSETDTIDNAMAKAQAAGAAATTLAAVRDAAAAALRRLEAV